MCDSLCHKKMGNSLKQYNLRSSQRKKKNYNCYQQKLLENRPINEFNPIVKLERLKVLENPECLNGKIYLHKGKVVIKKKANGLSCVKNNFVTIFFFTILILSTAIYFKVDVQEHCNKLIERSEGFYQIAKTNVLNLKKFYEKFIKEGVKETIKKEFSKSKVNIVMANNNKSNIEFEIKQMIKAHFEELSKSNTKEEVMESTSFIDEQCKKEEVSNKVNNFTSSPSNFDEKHFTSAILTDYALELRGAKILSTFDTEPYGIITLKFWNYEYETQNFFLQKFFNSRGPTSVLVPWTKPGDCWAFKGTHGQILIELSDKIVVSAITIDHIRSELLPKNSIQSAPKKFSATGIAGENGHVSERIHLGSFEYKRSGPLSQTFLIIPKVETSFKVIEFNFESNHGNQDYTCIYKIRVHGYE